MTPTTVRHIKDGTYDPANLDHVYIGRAMHRYGLPQSKWSNPYRMRGEWDRDNAIAHYAAYLNNSSLRDKVAVLRGKTLYCWCSPKRCHGDLLAERANALPETA